LDSLSLITQISKFDLKYIRDDLTSGRCLNLSLLSER